ncbi:MULTISPECIES: DEAD/DEAH box helicase [Anaerotruncus]|jgi:ATP-dependent RNA helicase DeaD|uniref:DEAD/DEAH box helicase n=1 Tax=Anaerotruncus TaxID=244127 RepID=UPI00082D0F69|nr:MULTISPECIES: DEAD/DEAH box helicase [Anaerotruncus]RGX56926.1 DEAD/DEAH box helicase [Anaerotruncus sp. AF02-27]
MANYSELQNVSPEILQAVERMGFTEMTEIQEKAIPVMLEGHEIIAKAPTGTGKTCAFGIPLIEKVDPDLLQVQAIVLCPTRELCTQITEDLRNLAFFKHGLKVVAVYGGQPIDKQIGALKRGAQVVVATPGRLLDHMHRRTINISKAKIAVLDEADEMLDMGFYKDVCKILDALPKEKQMVMFSATISREVMDIGWIYQRDTVELTVEPVQDSEPRISQYMIESVGRQKLADLVYILRANDYHRSIIFCNTKYSTASLAGQLTDRGFDAACLNGDMQQGERNRIMAKFKAGEIEILVATDVAARGIDVTDVDAVFNYEIPLENEYYTHRIGRTGRAKKAGTAYVFYGPDDRKRLDNIIRYTRSHVIELEFNEAGELVEKS